MSFNVEVGLITKILETRDLMPVRENQIKLSFFQGDNRNAYQFILDQVSSTGEVPTIRVFQRRFPTYPLDKFIEQGSEQVGNEESMEYWCSELRRKVEYNTLADAVDDAAKALLDNQNSEEAMKILRNKLTFLDSEVEFSHEESVSNTEGRKEAYLKKKKNEGMLGISTGFKHLDFMTKGLIPSTLTVILATAGTGKSWFEVLIGAHCSFNGMRVLQLMTEMSNDIMRDRYEAAIFSKLYGSLNYEAFRSGKLTTKQEREYFSFLESDMSDMGEIILANATGVMNVASLIEKHKPDIILIDGVYLMEDDQGAKDDWLKIAHITRDLKKLAKKLKTIIVVNTQADQNTSKKTGPELSSIRYSRAVGEDADNVIALYQDAVMRSDGEMGIKILKQREGMLGKLLNNWDFSSMNFSEIYMEKEESGDEEKENTIDIERLE